MKTFSKVNSQKIHVPHVLSQETPGGRSQTNDSTENEKAVGSQEGVGAGGERNGTGEHVETRRRRTGRGRPDSRGSERPRNAPWGS